MLIIEAELQNAKSLPTVLSLWPPASFYIALLTLLPKNHRLPFLALIKLWGWEKPALHLLAAGRGAKVKDRNCLTLYASEKS